MSNARFKGLNTILSRPIPEVKPPSSKISDFFGIHVFDKKKMQAQLPTKTYEHIAHLIDSGEALDHEIAVEMAFAMKTWAMAHGATHYTHWFQPLTGITAEKHDAFFEFDADLTAIESFSGMALTQEEPDASSFPSGGIRNTFEARGYTLWDPSSPVFIMENKCSKTLCIPAVFVSYTGETLDYKAPLLKALAALDKAATAVCHYFDPSVKKVNASLGIEQEYFLVDLALFYARPDLYLTGRTLFGQLSANGQQLEDHYFGVIPERVHAFMVDLETEAFKLGIPLKTRHNEVAPSQFECAPIHEEVNLAIDHNQLLMTLMDQTAKKHHFKVLLHEKPYAALNGSGKHNNWSMITDTGKNLLSPGKTPRNNLSFLTFFVSTIKAVHEHADLLRSSIASLGNDHRLGANEAPPAIISIFLGSQLNEILDDVETSMTDKNIQENLNLQLGIPKISKILLDYTDRNRTSPFAFTGNKFELRAVGSASNSAGPMTILNTIVANQLRLFKIAVDQLIQKGEKKDLAILTVLKQHIKESKNSRFEGNGYSEAWAKEAMARGLSHIKTTSKALDADISEKTIKLFEICHVFNRREAYARHEIRLETFYKKLQIEVGVMAELVQNTVIPTVITYQNRLIKNIKGLQDIGLNEDSYQAQLETVFDLSKYLNAVKKNVNLMIKECVKADQLKNLRERAIAYDEQVKSYFELIRYDVDQLEQLVDDAQWPLPKLRELLFIR